MQGSLPVPPLQKFGPSGTLGKSEIDSPFLCRPSALFFSAIFLRFYCATEFTSSFVPRHVFSSLAINSRRRSIPPRSPPLSNGRVFGFVCVCSLILASLPLDSEFTPSLDATWLMARSYRLRACALSWCRRSRGAHLYQYGLSLGDRLSKDLERPSVSLLIVVFLKNRRLANSCKTTLLSPFKLTSIRSFLGLFLELAFSQSKRSG